MENSLEYQAAKKRVEAKMGFYTHLAVYVVVIAFLAFINIITSPGTMWVQWPAMGWGIAVVLHAIFVFVFPARFAVTEAMIEKEMGKSHLHS